MGFVQWQKYRMFLPEEKEPVEVTYCGFWPHTGGFECWVCRQMRAGVHIFTEGDPNNPKWNFNVGSECVKKLRFEPLN